MTKTQFSTSYIRFNTYKFVRFKNGELVNESKNTPSFFSDLITCIEASGQLLATAGHSNLILLIADPNYRLRRTTRVRRRGRGEQILLKFTLLHNINR